MAGKKRSRGKRSYLALLKVDDVRGKPAAIFGKIELADDQPMEGFEVATLSPEDATLLRQILERTADDGAAPASGT